MINMIKVRVILVMISILGYTLSSHAQIEDEAKVDEILTNTRSLSKLYANYPNAKAILQASNRDRRNGILSQVGGIGVGITGGYLMYKAIFRNSASSNSNFIELPDFSKIERIGIGLGGLILITGGVALTNNGSRLVRIAHIKRRGSVQQYIWDQEYQSAVESHDGIFLGLTDNGVGFVLVF